MKLSLLLQKTLLAALSGITGSCEISQYYLPSEGPIADLSSSAVHTLAAFAGLQTWAKSLNQFETPIAARFAHLIDVMNWNCAAVYSDGWKNSITKTDLPFYTPKEVLADGEGAIMINLHSSDTRLLCMVNAWATVVRDWVPEAVSVMMNHLDTFMYPAVQAGYDADVDICFDLVNDSADNDCLYQVAKDSCFAPSKIGSIIGRQVNEYAKHDGWNMYGDLNSDGTHCEANCRRYIDPTNALEIDLNDRYGSSVQKTANTKKATKKTTRKTTEMTTKIYNDLSNTWKPLLEDNGHGYFVNQMHVTPHIGFIGKTWLLTREQFEARKLNNPNYDYNKESHLVLKRMASLSDADKMLIEFFDSKIPVNFAVIEAVVMKGTTFEQVLNFAVGITAAEYDATLLAWKEKVRHNLIRPTTWIQENLSNQSYSIWAGPGAGIKQISGKNFEAYIRVMPHAEYISGSACLCQTISEFTDSWLASNIDIRDSVPINLSFEKHSSKVEPGLTPNNDIHVSFENMSAFRDACGYSRLKGGMHFTYSVPDAYELCTGVGFLAADYAKDLWG